MKLRLYQNLVEPGDPIPLNKPKWQKPTRHACRTSSQTTAHHRPSNESQTQGLGSDSGGAEGCVWGGGTEGCVWGCAEVSGARGWKVWGSRGAEVSGSRGTKVSGSRGAEVSGSGGTMGRVLEGCWGEGGGDGDGESVDEDDDDDKRFMTFFSFFLFMTNCALLIVSVSGRDLAQRQYRYLPATIPMPSSDSTDISPSDDTLPSEPPRWIILIRVAPPASQNFGVLVIELREAVGDRTTARAGSKARALGGGSEARALGGGTAARDRTQGEAVRVDFAARRARGAAKWIRESVKGSEGVQKGSRECKKP
ncbi:hypothetical protein C8J56DRAFT_898254 [Mycena floridula]|nr:hypothetical protein C8J56DRAFT_898254 [Mycena floridula]